MRKVRVFIISTLAAVVVVLLIATLGAWWTIRRPLPETTGTLELAGLTAATQISRDQASIPTITADHPADLFRAQGFAHAQDRMFQLAYARRRATGTLAALVGPQDQALASDRLMRIIGIKAAANAEYAALTPDTKTALQAYSDGINDYLDNRSLGDADIQYTILGTVVDLAAEPTWEPADSLAILKLHAWDTSSNVREELGRALAYGSLGDQKLVADMFPSYPHDQHPATVVRQDTNTANSVPPVGSPAAAEELDEAARAAGGLLAADTVLAGRGATSTAPAPTSTSDAGAGSSDPGGVGSGDVAGGVATDRATPPAGQTPPKGGTPGADATEPGPTNPAPTKPGPDNPDAGNPAPGQPVDDRFSPAGMTALVAAADVFAAADAWPGSQWGSMSWAVSGEVSETGSALLASTQQTSTTIPNQWLQNGLYCNTLAKECPYHVSGLSLPGVPGVYLGRTQKMAWATSRSSADTIDVFLERVAGHQVWHGSEWADLAVTAERVPVAGQGEEVVMVGRTPRGPLITPVLPVQAGAADLPAPEASPLGVAISWTGSQPSRAMDGVLAMNRANDWQQFTEAARLFDAPAPALTYADAEGQIAFQVTGRIPIRGRGDQPGMYDGTWPRAGWAAEWEWLGERAFESLPGVLNPPGDVIVAGGQSPDAVVKPVGGDADYGYRSHRVGQLLRAAAGRGGVSAGQLAEVAWDAQDQVAPHVVPFLLAVPLQNNPNVPEDAVEFTQEAVDELKNWSAAEYLMAEDSPGAAYYAAVYGKVLQLAFADEVPPSITVSGESRWAAVLQGILDQPDNALWDDRFTPATIERRDDVLAAALYQARIELTADLGKRPTSWRWADLQQIRLQNPPLGTEQAAWWARNLLTARSAGVAGSPQSVAMVTWPVAQARDYQVTSLAGGLLVADPAAAEHNQWLVAGGASGHVASDHFDDQWRSWQRRTAIPWQPATDTSRTLVLQPASSDAP